MQKAGLLAALAVTIAVAIYAYPKGDRSLGAGARIGGIGKEHDNSQPTPLDKLKSATRVGAPPQQESALPPPRVMEHVKQEIQTRPAAHDAAAARQPAGEMTGIEKLAGKLPAPTTQPALSATPVATTPVATNPKSVTPPASAQPAPTQSSTLVIPAANTIGAAAAGTVVPGASPSSESKPADGKADQAHSLPQGQSAESKIEDGPRTGKPAGSERRRAASRDTGSAPRNGLVNRPVRQTSVFNRNDGL